MRRTCKLHAFELESEPKVTRKLSQRSLEEETVKNRSLFTRVARNTASLDSNRMNVFAIQQRFRTVKFHECEKIPNEWSRRGLNFMQGILQSN